MEELETNDSLFLFPSFLLFVIITPYDSYIFTGTTPSMLPLNIRLLPMNVIKLNNRILNTLFSSSWYAMKATFLRLKKMIPILHF